MFKLLKKASFFFVISILLIFIFVVIFLNSELLSKKYLLTQVNSENLTIDYNNVAFNPFTGVSFKNLSIDLISTKQKIYISSFKLRYSILNLLSGKVSIKELKARDALFCQAIECKDSYLIGDLYLKGSFKYLKKGLFANVDLHVKKITEKGENILTREGIKITAKILSDLSYYKINEGKIFVSQLNDSDLSFDLALNLPQDSNNYYSFNSSNLYIDELINLYKHFSDMFVVKGNSSQKKEDTPIKGIMLKTNLKNVVYKDYLIKDLVADLVTENKKLKSKKLSFVFSEGEFLGDLLLGLGEEKVLELKSEIGKVNTTFFKENINNSNERIDSIKLNLYSKDYEKATFPQGFYGDLEIKAKSILLPAKTSNLFPFNIILLPFEALSNILGSVTDFVLPESLTEEITEMNQTIENSDYLKLLDSKLFLELKKGKFYVKNSYVNIDKLPTTKFNGYITEKDISLKSYLKFLSLNLPIPLKGTISSPRADLKAILPELIKALGLTIEDSVEILVGGDNT